MTQMDRRGFLKLAGGAAGAATLLPQVLREALAIPAATCSGTIMDVEHVVILMQENRSFDHYFGTLRGVRGFGDRFTVPQPEGRKVWQQLNLRGEIITSYHLDGTVGNAQRVDGTPHGWADSVPAWNKGRFGHWPTFKENQSMGYYREAELPFQFALADSFTICDAYHCSYHGNTNPNRLFMFTGWNDPLGTGGGPRLYNDNDDLGPAADGFTWTTYAERLEAAGVSWKVYQDMDDNFTDNSLEGFRSFRAAYENREADPANPLLLKGLTTTLARGSFDGLRNDVLGGTLPQVSYIVAPAEFSEHTGPSSPVQGGWFIAETIKALISDPQVWSKTVLLVMFDENDGFFDHVPPPAAPSYVLTGQLTGAKAGASTVDTTGEYYEPALIADPTFRGGVFGPGPRVPMYVISPWSRGGWVNSQCFDHTSIIRFLEARFGVAEPNITAYRRAMLGDLTSCFNFVNPNDEPFPELPSSTQEAAAALRAAQEALAQIPAPVGDAATLPLQTPGPRYSRALPYELHVDAQRDVFGNLQLVFSNTGSAGAVFHVYDQFDLDAVPRRYAVEPGKQLADVWVPSLSGYDLWVLGPNGFHRRLKSGAAEAGPELKVCYDIANGDVQLRMINSGDAAMTFKVAANAYGDQGPWLFEVAAGSTLEHGWVLKNSASWYDFSVTVEQAPDFLRRVAGRVETGRHGVSDPAMGVVG